MGFFIVFFYSGFWFMWKDLAEMRVGFSGFILFYGLVVMEIQMVEFSGFKEIIIKSKLYYYKKYQNHFNLAKLA